jgi:hypothetical protein
MTKTKKPEVSETITVPSKPQQILDLLIRYGVRRYRLSSSSKA